MAIANDKVGDVRSYSRRIVELQVSLDSYMDIDNEAEYVLTVNGRTIKRMNAFQLRRLIGNV